MINENQKYFLNILSDFINNRSSKCNPELSEELLKYIYLHQVAPVFYHQIKSERLKSTFYAQLYRHQNIRREMIDLFEIFDSLGIDYFTVKGDLVADYYPVPELRSMGDIDLIVKKPDKAEVDKLLEIRGYKCLRKDDRAWNYLKNGIEIELHHKLFYDNEIGEIICSFFDKAWDYCANHKLENSYHFLFVICHLQKHLMGPGVGFRQFMDVAILTKYMNIDWETIKNTADALGLTRFIGTIFEFNKRWFEISYPDIFGNIIVEDDFFDEVSHKIFTGGVFGTNEEANSKNTVVNAIRRRGKVGLFVKLLKDTFLSYDRISRLPEYSYLKNRKYLLVFAWFSRIIRKLKNRQEIKSKYLLPKEVVNARVQFLEKWGL